MNGPRWIKLWIAELALLNEQYRDDDGKVDFEALGREEYNFRIALITQKFGKSQRAKEVFEQAKIAYEANVQNGSKGGRPKKNKRISAALNSNTNDESTTGGNPDNNESVDADTRKDADECTYASNGGTLKSDTSTDSTVYDKEAKSTSTNEARQNQRTATAPKGKKTKKADSHSAKAAVRPLPPTVQEVYDFAEQQKIDKDDARDCFEMCESRQWADQYGELIGDWKGFIIGFCKSREEKRKSA